MVFDELLPEDLELLVISADLRDKLLASPIAQQIVKAELSRLSEDDRKQRARDLKRARSERSCGHESPAPTPDEITVERALLRAEHWDETTHRLRAGLPIHPDPVQMPTADDASLLLFGSSGSAD